MSKIISGMKRGLAKGITCILMSTPFMFNCNKDLEEIEPINTNTMIFENVKILSDEKLNDISNIDSYGIITFANAQNYFKGDIIVGGISGNTPGGLLKKIEDISEDGTLAKTVNVSLEEVIENGEFSIKRKSSRGNSTMYSLEIKNTYVYGREREGDGEFLIRLEGEVQNP